ncbi:hypothetical protein [uncultured Winogradskyella sp.]|uniref:hypothetical protein n=1 Tax=uncultured Winogradskyella sp. TaxID=395353 RepID=UPI0035122624
MELSVNQDLDLEPEPLVLSCNTTEGLLRSKYKAVVNQNFRVMPSQSLFGLRQGLKSFQFNTVNHTAGILKLAVFVTALILIF